MAYFGSRRGAANLAIPLMIVAFLVIAAFMWWLSATAEGTTGPVEDTATADAGNTGPRATDVGLADLQSPPDSLIGQTIRVADASVLSRMGGNAFWVELPSGNPFLVRLAPSLVADSLRVEQSQRVTVVGPLHAMSDSVLTAWLAGKVITEGQRIEAEFATHFIEAQQMTARGAPRGGNDQGDGDAEG